MITPVPPLAPHQAYTLLVILGDAWDWTRTTSMPTIANRRVAGVLLPLLWALVAFVAGAIPFSLLIGRLALDTDIRDVGDGNPGATNVLRAGSKLWAFVAAFLDMIKAALPVALAYVVFGWQGYEIVPIAVAPLLGHNYSPFLQGKGGKGIAVTGGIWIGLTKGVGGAIGTGGLTLGYLCQSNPGWAVICGLSLILGYLLIWHRDPVLLVTWAANSLLVLWRHRHDLQQPPQWRDWMHRTPFL